MTVALDYDAERMPVVAKLPSVTASGRMALRRAAVAEPRCLVASANGSLQRRLSAAAELGGWEVGDAPLEVSSFAALLAEGPELVVVDLTAPVGGDAEEIVTFAAKVAARNDMLLIICGADGDEGHELIARELGAFVYIPGVAPGDSLVSVFRQAFDVVGKSRRPVASSCTIAPRNRLAVACR